jgi:N6-L-threonylcarbamoyladenine synthase
MLVEVRQFGAYRVLGRTVDDAAGEAFDKVAKLLGLGYPGGAELDRLASGGDPKYHRFPRARLDNPYQFSYSGLKTAVALYLDRISESEREQHLADIAASFQEAAVDVLVEKATRAAEEVGVRDVTVSGGVAANSRLRAKLRGKLEAAGRRLFYPSVLLCTDNAAMIAAAGHLHFQNEGPSEMVVDAVPYLRIDEIQ